MQAQPQRRTRFLQPHLAAFDPRHEVLLWNLWFVGGTLVQGLLYSCPSRIEIQWRYRWCICFICSLLFLLFEKLNVAARETRHRTYKKNAVGTNGYSQQSPCLDKCCLFSISARWRASASGNWILYYTLCALYIGSYI